jgi:uncharacterized cofD-like protein
VHGQIELEAMTGVPPRIWLDPQVAATPEAVQAVVEADLILFGPGSFMTSILPALLLPDFRAAVAASRAPRVLIANLHPEPGPVGLLEPAALLRWTREVLGVQVFDRVLWPASRPAPELDGVQVLVAPLAASDPRAHEPTLLAQALERCLGGAIEIDVGRRDCRS